MADFEVGRHLAAGPCPACCHRICPGPDTDCGRGESDALAARQTTQKPCINVRVTLSVMRRGTLWHLGPLRGWRRRALAQRHFAPRWLGIFCPACPQALALSIIGWNSWTVMQHCCDRQVTVTRTACHGMNPLHTGRVPPRAVVPWRSGHGLASRYHRARRAISGSSPLRERLRQSAVPCDPA